MYENKNVFYASTYSKHRVLTPYKYLQVLILYNEYLLYAMSTYSMQQVITLRTRYFTPYKEYLHYI